MLLYAISLSNRIRTGKDLCAGPRGWHWTIRYFTFSLTEGKNTQAADIKKKLQITDRMWEPISAEALKRHLDNLEYLFSEDQKCFWNFMKIDPQKWSEATMGDEGDGFWVVALFGKHGMYYNEFEEGFNISSYQEYGKIDQYRCGQSELHDLVADL